MTDAATAPKTDVFQDMIDRVSGPIVIVNLLKFQADAGDGRTGAEAYADYGDRIAGLERTKTFACSETFALGR